MNYQQFICMVEKTVKEKAGGNVGVYVYSSIKNNGKERKGLVLSEEGINISPTIYLEEFYEKYRKGETIEKITNDILRMYDEVRFQNSWEATWIQDYEKIKDKIAYKLISRERNLELLKEVPYLPYLDLAVVFYLVLKLNQHGAATMLVRYKNMADWGIDVSVLRTQADLNTPAVLPAVFLTMKSVVAEMTGEELTEENESDDMYVLSNDVRNYGAGSILYPGLLKQIGSRLEENYYVLPSSVHEVIIIPESASPGRDELEIMIQDINNTQVLPEEILSDGPYYYDRKKRELIL